uniref:Uncharacterized LOC103172324 n=1 Tax=Callorhinchus milii TaxID=7868 RepID=A0A4W3GC34_CALMI
MEFYAVVSLTEPPVRLFSKFHGSYFHCQLPLPLPKQLVVFGLGNWGLHTEETYLSVEVSVSPEVKAQKIGSLSSDTRCLVWEGDWSRDILSTAVEEAERGSLWTLLITSGQVGTSASMVELIESSQANMDTTLPFTPIPLYTIPNNPCPCAGGGKGRGRGWLKQVGGGQGVQRWERDGEGDMDGNPGSGGKQDEWGGGRARGVGGVAGRDSSVCALAGEAVWLLEQHPCPDGQKACGPGPRPGE